MPALTSRKPGPLRTGSRRPYVVPVTVAALENEYLTRKSVSLGQSKSAYIRSAALPMDWESELDALRALQPSLSVHSYTKKPHVRDKAD